MTSPQEVIYLFIEFHRGQNKDCGLLALKNNSRRFTVGKCVSKVLQTFCSYLQNPHFRKTNTGYSAGPGLESYLKGFNFTGEPPWALYS